MKKAQAKVITEFVENESLNARTKKLISKELIEIKKRKNISPEFPNAKEAIAYLKRLSKA